MLSISGIKGLFSCLVRGEGNKVKGKIADEDEIEGMMEKPIKIIN